MALTLFEALFFYMIVSISELLTLNHGGLDVLGHGSVGQWVFLLLVSVSFFMHLWSSALSFGASLSRGTSAETSHGS